MNVSRLLLPLLLGSILLAVPVAAATQANVASQRSADERLRALYNSEWEWRLKEFGQLKGSGPGARAGYLPKVDPLAQQRRLAYWTRALAELDRIPLAQLSPEERINAAVFRTSIQELAGDVRFRTYEMPFNSDTFFWGELGRRQGLQEADEYVRYNARLRDIPRYFREQTANVRAGLP